MLQPFEEFKLIYIQKLRQLKKRYLVTQSYPRADVPTENQKTSILISDYDDLGQAKIHQNAIKHDKYNAIVDMENPVHFEKLKQMLDQDSRYQLFWAVVRSAKELQDRVNRKYKDHMRRYIKKNTNWNIDRDTTLYPSLIISFGELFIQLKHGNQNLRLKFEEIENS